MAKTIKLADGVFVHVIPTTQFATTRIEINFSESLNQERMGDRIIIANMLENSSEKYPSQTDLARRLSEMYGAAFGVETVKNGQVHTMRVRLNLVHDIFTNPQTSLVPEGFAFLAEMLNRPLGSDEAGFDATIFNRQQDNILDELAGLEDDRPYVARRNALSMYYDDAAMALPAYGSVDLVEASTPLRAWQTWQTTLANNQIDIIVLGDVQEAELMMACEQLHFAGRQTNVSPYYEQAEPTEPQVANVTTDANQTQVVQIYQLNVTDEKRFAAYAFDDIFGGVAVSRLFSQVREVQGLAYTVSSDFNYYNRTVTVTAGVDQSRLADAKASIQEELVRLQTELISDDELATIKKLMLTSYLTGLDSQSQLTDRAFDQTLSNRQLNQEAWLAKLESVSVEDVRDAAKQMKLAVDYTAMGAANESSEEV